MKEEIRKYIREIGADDVGFAAVQDYVSPNTPKIETFFPKAKSIIVMAYKELSTCECIDPKLAMNGRMDKDEFVRANDYKICHYLEDEFKAKVVSVPTAFPKSEPSEVSLRHAAYAAGLGTFGRHNLIIHPRFGTRVTFSAIITDLDIESDEKVTDNPCNNCNICVKNCPAKALDEKGKTDIMKCIKVSQPYSFISYLDFLDKFVEADRLERKKMVRNFLPFYEANAHMTQYYCFNCMKLCPAGRK